MRVHSTYRGARVKRALPALIPLAVALVIPASSLAQATRTWVSGVGDDANPCSRTAPCKTFAGAISKTATGGEINVLDPGGFGALTITKSITVSATGATAGVLVSGTNGFVVVAPGAQVILKGLDFDGLGTGLNGVRVDSAANVRIEDSDIYGFVDDGVNLDPSSGVVKLALVDDSIYDNTGDGFLDAPTGTGKGKATLIDDQIQNNQCGVVAASFGGGGAAGSNCGVNTSGSPLQATITTFDTTIADQTSQSDSTGVFSEGSGASNRIGGDNVIGNSDGLLAGASGVITSFGDNNVIGNTTNGSPTPPNATKTSAGQRRHTKHRKKSRKRTRKTRKK
jgi:hypothetical protein